MSEMLVDESPTTDRSERTALCFVVDPDFGFLQNFCKQLRSAGVDAVELLNSSRLAENVDDHNPDLVFVDASPTNPSDCARALMSLKDCRYGGRVQLIGRCETSLLEGFRKLGTDSMLDMLPALQKPINFSDVRKTIAQQKLNSRPVAAPGFTLKSPLSSDFITFWYQPKVDLLKRRVVGAEAFARIAHPQHGIIAPAHFLARADDEDIIELAKRALVSTLKLSAKLDELGIALQLAINIDYETNNGRDLSSRYRKRSCSTRSCPCAIASRSSGSMEFLWRSTISGAATRRLRHCAICRSRSSRSTRRSCRIAPPTRAMRASARA